MLLRKRTADSGGERRAAVPDVVVNVDQPGRDVKTGDIHDLAGLIGGDILSHCCDLAKGNGNIHFCIEPVGRIDDVASLQQQIVARHLRYGPRLEDDKPKCE